MCLSLTDVKEQNLLTSLTRVFWQADFKIFDNEFIMKTVAIRRFVGVIKGIYWPKMHTIFMKIPLLLFWLLHYRSVKKPC